MTAKELQKRNEKSQHLRVVQIDEQTYYVESSEGKICYRVSFEGDKQVCTCGDFSRGIKTDPSFRCKHIISVYNSIPNGEVQNGKVMARVKPKLDPKYILEVDGQEFVSFKGLLQLGHQMGIAQLSVEILQFPSSDNSNTSVCKAVLVSKIGEEFCDIGDASPSNTNSRIAKHIIRMSSTRALARVLRLFTGCGITAIEELSDLNDVAGGNDAGHTRPKTKQTAKPPKANSGTKEAHPVVPNAASTEPNTGNGGNGAKSSKKPTEPTKQEPNPEQSMTQSPSVPTMSEAQKRAIFNLSRRRGISVEELGKMAVEAYGIELEHLTSKDASSFIRNLQQAA